MAREHISFENRYHVEIFDESGAQIMINNMTRDELDDFRFCHETDDLDYHYEMGPIRP